MKRTGNGCCIVRYLETTFCVTVELDIINFLRKIKETKLSFDWGEYFERDGKIILPFSVQANHCLVDGVHIGRLVDSLQKHLNEYA